MWRIRQQLRLLIWLLIFIGAVSIVFYWLSKDEASCFDGVKNGDEFGVDCGGSCRLLCQTDVFPVVNHWIRVLPEFDREGNFENEVTVVALNRNPNNSFVPSLPYQIKVFDDNGELISEIKENIHVNPLTEFVIFKNNIKVENSRPNQAFVEFGKGQWLKVPAETPKVEAVVLSYQDEDFPRLSVQVNNDSLENLKNTFITAILLDEEGNAFAASRSLVDPLGAGEVKTIFFTWPNSFPIRPSGFVLVPEVDVF